MGNLCYIKNQISIAIRRIWYSSHFRKFGEKTKIYGRVICLGNNIEIGKNSTLNEGVLLNSKANIHIGDFCHISPYVQIHTGALNLDEYYTKRGHISKEVVIEDGVWLCAGVIVTPGVRIGEGSVIAAGAVVNKNIPKFELWGGVPARKIRKLKQN